MTGASISILSDGRTSRHGPRVVRDAAFMLGMRETALALRQKYS
jgi:hypothetical protein